MANERGTLNVGEPHPAAYDAMGFIRSLGMEKLNIAMASYSSCAIEGNRVAEICTETLRRILNGDTVSDRYLLGLAWNLHMMFDCDRSVCKAAASVVADLQGNADSRLTASGSHYLIDKGRVDHLIEAIRRKV